MKDAASIRSMFASIARRYDFLNHLLSLNQDKRWRTKTVRATAAGNEKKVLDVCSGTADLALAFARVLGPDCLIVGADFTPEMLALGKKKSLAAPNGAAEKIALLAADTLQLPFAGGIFDIVSVAFGIRNVSDLRGGIKEMARVARSGGTVAILEFSVPEGRLFASVYRFYFTQLLPRIGRAVSRAGDAYSYLPVSVLQFPEKKEMALIMEGCGLGNIRATSFSLGIVTLYLGEKPYPTMERTP